MEHKYLPVNTSSSGTAADDDMDEEVGDDLSPPDEELEEGEVPPELVQSLLPAAQHM
jgi:hypothetical protein